MPAGPRVEAQPCSNQSPPFTSQPGPQSDPAASPWCVTDRRGQGASRPELGRDTPGGCPRDTVPRAHSGGLDGACLALSVQPQGRTSSAFRSGRGHTRWTHPQPAGCDSADGALPVGRRLLSKVLSHDRFFTLLRVVSLKRTLNSAVQIGFSVRLVLYVLPNSPTPQSSRLCSGTCGLDCVSIMKLQPLGRKPAVRARSSLGRPTFQPGANAGASAPSPVSVNPTSSPA